MIFETIAVGSFLGALSLAAALSRWPLSVKTVTVAMVLGVPASTVGALVALFLRGLL